jgi:hypothetical protein
MSNASFTIAPAQQQNGGDRNSIICRATVTIVGGTYVAGGFGPLGIASLFNTSPSSNVPVVSKQDSISNPPSPVFWRYNPATDKLMAYVPGTAGSPPIAGFAEFAGTIDSDTVSVEQTFSIAS